MTCDGELVDIDDTALWVDARGPSDGVPVLLLHGGPGLDHHLFGDYLDPLADRGIRLIAFDRRGEGRSGRPDPATWTLERHAQDVIMLALALRLERYVVLGHSLGAFVALQHAVDYPATAIGTIASAGVPSGRWLEGAVGALEALEPPALREQVRRAWEVDGADATPEEIVTSLYEQLPFHFADPTDPRIDAYIARTDGLIGSPDAVARFDETPGIDLEDRLLDVPHPVLLLAGEHDRGCPASASVYMSKLLPDVTLRVFEDAAHMAFVEAQEDFLDEVATFVERISR
jgi:proline iminopeptidase